MKCRSQAAVRSQEQNLNHSQSARKYIPSSSGRRPGGDCDVRARPVHVTCRSAAQCDGKADHSTVLPSTLTTDSTTEITFFPTSSSTTSTYQQPLVIHNCLRGQPKTCYPSSMLHLKHAKYQACYTSSMLHRTWICMLVKNTINCKEMDEVTVCLSLTVWICVKMTTPADKPSNQRPNMMKSSD